MSQSEYVTQLGTPYYFPFEAGESPPPMSHANVPCYIDGKMRLFDKNYDLVALKPIEAQTSGPFSFPSFSADEIFPDFSDLQFPCYFLFPSKEQFEKACRAWLDQARRFLSGLFCPYPLLSKIYFPTKATIIEGNTPVYRKFDQIKNPLQPKNMMVLHVHLFTQDSPDYEEQFPLQLPKRDIVRLKHHLTPEPQWQTQMLPIEPLHTLFDSFEEYENSYMKWYNIAAEELTTPPIPPEQFQTILGINETVVVPPQVFNPSEIVNVKEEAGVDYSWVEKVPQSPLQFQIKDKSYKVRSEVGTNDDVYVFGVDKKTFLDDFKQFGVHWDTFTSSTTKKPFKSICYSPEPGAEAAFSQYLEEMKKNNNMFGFTSINFDLSMTQKMLNQIITPKFIFHPDLLKILFEIASLSDQYCLKVAMILPVLASCHQANNMIEYLLRPKRLDLLYQFTKIALCLSSENHTLFPPFEDDSQFAVIVEQMHLTSLLLALPVTKFGLPFEETLMSFCHTQSRLICKMLKDEELSAQLWDSVKRDKPNETTPLMFVLEGIHSDYITSALIGHEMLSKIIEISPYVIGQKFIYRFIFLKGGQSASQLIRNSNLFCTQTIYQIDQIAAYIVALFIDEYSRFLLEKHCYAPLQDLNHILTNILHCYTQTLNPIISSIIHLITSPDLVSPNDATFYDGLIGTFVGQVCIQCAYDSQLTLSDAIMMLEPCMQYSNCTEQILLNPGFVIQLIQEMNGSSKKLVQEAWHLFNHLVSKSSFALKLFRFPDIGKVLQPIASSENPIIFQKFSHFVKQICEMSNLEVLDTLAEVLSSTIGRIACTFKNASKLFQSSPNTVLSTEQMIISVLQTNGKFKTNLATHLSSLDINWKKLQKKSK